MIVTAYAQAGPPKTVRLWVGILGTEQPPQPRFFIDTRPIGALGNSSPAMKRSSAART